MCTVYADIQLAAWAALLGAPACALRRAGRPAWPRQGGACCNTSGKHVKTVKTVKTAVKTDWKTDENRENRAVCLSKEE